MICWLIVEATQASRYQTQEVVRASPRSRRNCRRRGRWPGATARWSVNGDWMGIDQLALPLMRATHEAAMACLSWVGRGDRKAADAAATEAMRVAQSHAPGRGKVVIGEGEQDGASMRAVGSGEDSPSTSLSTPGTHDGVRARSTILRSPSPPQHRPARDRGVVVHGQAGRRVLRGVWSRHRCPDRGQRQGRRDRTRKEGRTASVVGGSNAAVGRRGGTACARGRATKDSAYPHRPGR